ncbi:MULTISPECIES: type VII secretion integral membrane protein EccD [unclassified Streptomyces]|uniref:type VII secretion integral membrane protein EccD n=1 Tax=unclassified Streptomyces TaxID=2593676 RepID=UPI002E80698A|nr:type VII secretion integral membrane protein EccD [Streptomyces sp. NBC_00589]WTI39649.1 type VII secretion integral membrane protein EccD [Streptomyces sp. NBC_00775]WUB26672.1 type VII secretion integral membrane protein EccD [Streptomyces sp. NBC_00589]
MSRTTASGRTALSRVTLVGEGRRVDLVLPSREPIGLLLPEVIRLLDDRASGRPELRHLITADGSALDHDSTLESAGVPDGAVLRLVRVEDAPSAPVVHDVTDEVADDLNVRAWRWRPAVRRVVAGLATVFWAVAAGVLAQGEFELSAVGDALLGAAVVSALTGALCGRAGKRGLATTLIVTAGALGVLGAWTSADAYGWSGAVRLEGVAAAMVVALLLAGGFSPLGRGALIGAAAVGGCLVLWEEAAALQGGAETVTGQARLGAVLAVVSVVVLGVLPRLALMASGLSSLDDRRTGGASVSRYQVATALAATHRGLACATVVLAASATAAGVLVLRAPSVWTVLLAGVTAVVLALRARAYPLTAEVVALLVAASVVTVRLIVVWLGDAGAAGPIAVLALLAVAPLAVLAVEPAEHVRVRLRRAGDLLESVGVIALLPLLVGAFGVYGRLLGTFA